MRSDFGIKSLSTEFLDKKQMEMKDAEYLKWLKIRYISLWAEALEKRKNGLIISQESINQAGLLEKEIDKIKSRVGEPVGKEKKFIEEFSGHENIIK